MAGAAEEVRTEPEQMPAPPRQTRAPGRRRQETASEALQRHLGAGFIVLVIAAAIWFVQQSGASADPNWLILRKWLLDNGGEVHGGLRSTAVSHGGRDVRGVITDLPLKPGMVIMRVPKKLWLRADNLAHLPISVSFESVPECGAEDPVSFMAAARLAIELKTGEFFGPMLHSTPQLEQYRDYHPLLTVFETRADFSYLPLLRNMVEDHNYEAESVRTCFNAWKEAAGPLSPLRQVSFDDLLRARFHFKTRSLEGSTIVPAFDMLNTAKPSMVNTRYRIDGDMLEVITDSDVAPGSELISSYCNDCDNEIMLARWGVYLEDNPNGLNNLDPNVDCEELREITMEELESDAASSSAALAAGWSAPRCRGRHPSAADEKPEPQPQLRCSLARLAWETCAETWAQLGWVRSQTPPQPAALKEHARMHSNVGVGLANVGRQEEAADRFRAVLRINPQSSEAQFNLAGMLAKMRDFEGAEMHLIAATTLDPADEYMARSLDALWKRKHRTVDTDKDDKDETVGAPES